ncbi:MAG: asparaginase, partial [Candidatus Marinimicrobia bacterium]|nr:asparaginase [Candidatus Neomarinimicrobiota bacterium]
MNKAIISYLLRNERVESIHLTHAALVGPEGETVFAAGFTDAPLYVRSAAKPFQAAVLHLSGAVEKYSLGTEDLAVACASHGGEPRHIEVLRQFQDKVGVSVDDLACGAHFPFNRQAEEQLLADGTQPTQLHNNCSGKHTAFLAAAKALGAPLEGYLEPDHPVQAAILMELKRLAGLDEIPVGVDGCSAPTYF